MRSRSAAVPAIVALLVLLAPLPPARAEITPDGGMLRYPDVGTDRVVFSFADDLWTVPLAGGLATPLSSPPGLEALPRFSPDGRWIAYMADYEGNSEIYVIPATGGVPRRVTWHPATEILCDWTPDGKILFFQNGLSGLSRQTRLFTVDREGGLPRPLPVPYGAFATLSPDGRQLLYTPHTRDFRTWKRYMGGMATDLWLVDLRRKTSRRVTDWPGTDTQPMWFGDTVYYLSDAGPAHRLNVWSWNPATGERRQVTRFTDDDVRFPGIGPGPDGRGRIVFQLGSGLHVLDLGSGGVRKLAVTIPGDRPTLMARPVNAAKFIQSWDISPSGVRAIVSARGDAWTLPAEHGTPRNLTRTSGVAERDPSWSPDGRWIAWFSDASGEVELWIAPADGRGKPRQLTRLGPGFRSHATWSPDSRYIAFLDKTGAILLWDMRKEELRTIARDPWNLTGPTDRGLSWSPDSRWFAYALQEEDGVHVVHVYDVREGKDHRVTPGFLDAVAPVFDREGKYLFYRQTLHFSPWYSSLDTSFIYPRSERLIALPLRRDVANPFAPKSDEEKPAKNGEQEKGGKKEKKRKKKGEKEKKQDKGGGENGKPGTGGGKDGKKDVRIDFDGIAGRAVIVPVPPGDFGTLGVNDRGHLVYVRRPVRGQDEPARIVLLDPGDEKHEEKVLEKKASAFVLDAHGKKMLVLGGGPARIRKAAPGDRAKPVVTEGMIVRIDPRAEWHQVFVDAWRIMRDFFYDPHMHGVDWAAVRSHYEAMLRDCVTRRDVGYVIREMIAELNVGHAYYFPSPEERGGGDHLPVGMPGCDFELVDGAYRITRIYRGAPWDVDARGPLARPGVDVHEGDWLLAVNGAPVDPSKAPWAAFAGLAGRTVTLTVSRKPVLDEDAREVTVKLLDSERELRFRAWVEHNRRYVAERTGGKVGYVYVPDTGINGQNELVRQFFPQVHRAALIIDERWNAGGQIPTRFIEILDRPVMNYWARRDGRDWPWPPDGHAGPKCMLINGLAGSGGDAFPAYFRRRHLGKLIGTRTWGGLVGISGNPGLIDGSRLAVPRFAYYDLDGTWGIEGHGVDPDIEVIDDPAKMMDGGDPQLDAAIEEMLRELADHPFVPPRRPPWPDRSGMGVPERDW